MPSIVSGRWWVFLKGYLLLAPYGIKLDKNWTTAVKSMEWESELPICGCAGPEAKRPSVKGGWKGFPYEVNGGLCRPLRLSFPCCDSQFELVEKTLTHQCSKSKVEKLLSSLVLKIKAPFQPKAITDWSTVRQSIFQLKNGIFLVIAIWSQDTRWPRAETNHRVQLELNKMTPWRKWLQWGPQIPMTCHFSMSHISLGRCSAWCPRPCPFSQVGQKEKGPQLWVHLRVGGGDHGHSGGVLASPCCGGRPQRQSESHGLSFANHLLAVLKDGPHGPMPSSILKLSPPEFQLHSRTIISTQPFYLSFPVF